MSIKLPRKFARGQKLENADVYGELFVWPEGYFQYAIDIRSRLSKVGACINVSFVLLDANQTPLGTYGMPPDQEWCVGPRGNGQPGHRYDQLYGQIAKDKLERAESVALVFRTKGQEVAATALQTIASTGTDLEFCPIPD